VESAESAEGPSDVCAVGDGSAAFVESGDEVAAFSGADLGVDDVVWGEAAGSVAGASRRFSVDPSSFWAEWRGATSLTITPGSWPVGAPVTACAQTVIPAKPTSGMLSNDHFFIGCTSFVLSL
jgi:hypothetical protein